MVSADMQVPCAATLSCIRNTLVLILPLLLYEYAPYPHTANKPMIPENVIKLEIDYLLDFITYVKSFSTV